MNMVSADPRLSPCIDLTQTSVIFTSNRVNRPITDYISDKRANSLDTDPNAFYYASRPVTLKNSASAIRVLLTGAISDPNDIRAFYAIQNDIDESVIFTPFPGFANLDTGRTDGRMKALGDSNGTPDVELKKNDYHAYVPGHRAFKENGINDPEGVMDGILTKIAQKATEIKRRYEAVDQSETGELRRTKFENYDNEITAFKGELVFTTKDNKINKTLGINGYKALAHNLDAWLISNYYYK